MRVHQNVDLSQTLSRRASEWQRHRHGLSLVELIVLLGIISIVMALLLSAVQKAREAALRAQCANNLYEIAIALHHYHDQQGALPPGVSTAKAGEQFPWMSWHTRLLPYLEQQSLWDKTRSAYQQKSSAFDDPPHIGLGTTLKVFGCPLDERTSLPQKTHDGLHVGLTSYVGVLGIDYTTQQGVLFADSHIRLSDIADGTSSTLMVGERPPSADSWYGWWYAGVAQDGSGSPDMVLGVRERHRNGAYLWFCSLGPYHYTRGTQTNECDVLHYWSLHTGGSNFLFADGSVHFLTYTADDILPALATRSGGEIIPPAF